MSKEIKSIEYNELDCWAEEDAVCPYCGCENYIEPESYSGQEDDEIIECDACEKSFVYQIDYSVTFTSEPLENYYLRSEEGLLSRIVDLKRTDSVFGHKEDADTWISIIEKEYAKLKEEVLPLLEEEE